MDAYASAAAEAFSDVERVRLLLEKKEKALTQAVVVMAIHSDSESKAEYFDLTTDILAKYEEKRVRGLEKG